jgi:hypothetical protein
MLQYFRRVGFRGHDVQEMAAPDSTVMAVAAADRIVEGQCGWRRNV